jgi:hypothetical protein
MECLLLYGVKVAMFATLREMHPPDLANDGPSSEGYGVVCLKYVLAALYSVYMYYKITVVTIYFSLCMEWRASPPLGVWEGTMYHYV